MNNSEEEKQEETSEEIVEDQELDEAEEGEEEEGQMSLEELAQVMMQVKEENKKIDLKKKITYSEVLKSLKKRDKSDYNRKIAPLKKTKDSVLINTTNLTKRACFLKIKKIIDSKINN